MHYDRHCNGGINFHFLFCSNVRLYKEAGLFITFPMPVNRNHHFSFTADSCLQIYKFYRVSKEDKKKSIHTRTLLIHSSWNSWNSALLKQLKAKARKV